MYRFLPVDRSPTVHSHAKAIAAAAPTKDRDNTYVVFCDPNPKPKKRKKSSNRTAFDSYHPLKHKSKIVMEAFSEDSHTLQTPKSTTMVKSPATVDFHPSTNPTAKIDVQSPDIVITYSTLLPPPPKPPQIAGVDQPSTERSSTPQSPWTRHLSSNGLYYFYNPSTGASTYMTPQGWSSPVTSRSPSPLHSTNTPINLTPKQSPIVAATTLCTPETRKLKLNDKEKSSLDDRAINAQGEAPVKKKLKRENVKRLSSLVDTAQKYNIPVDTLESLLIDVSCVSPTANDGKTHLNRNFHRDQHKFEQELHAKMAFARSNALDATLASMMAAQHKMHAECWAEVLQNDLQRATARHGVRSFEAEDKENHQNAF